MNIYTQLVEKIIQEQEGIIGSLALEQARKVKGLTVDWKNHAISIDGNENDVVENLIEQYKQLFGQASVEACKEAVRGLITQIPKDKFPNLLR